MKTYLIISVIVVMVTLKQMIVSDIVSTIYRLIQTSIFEEIPS